MSISTVHRVLDNLYLSEIKQTISGSEDAKRYGLPSLLQRLNSATADSVSQDGLPSLAQQSELRER